MIDFTKIGDAVTKTVNDTVKQLDVTKIDLTRLDLRNVTMPKFELSGVQMPSFDFPKFELPELDVPAEVERIADFVRDVTYAGIGAGVIAAQKVDTEVRKLVGKAA